VADWSRVLALFHVPRCSRAAIHLTDKVVSFRRRAAIWTFFRVGFEAQVEVGLGPAKALQSFGDDSVSHQTIGMNLKASLLASFSEGFEEILMIDIIVEDVFPAIPTAHQVINGAWILNRNFPGHFMKIN
jgi:hypothetical protein